MSHKSFAVVSQLFEIKSRSIEKTNKASTINVEIAVALKHLRYYITFSF